MPATNKAFEQWALTKSLDLRKTPGFTGFTYQNQQTHLLYEAYKQGVQDDRTPDAPTISTTE